MAKEVVINLKANTTQAEKNVQGLNEDLKETKDDLGGVENAGDQMTGGMISGFTGVLTSVKGAITGLKTMRGAIIATGIGALIIAVTSLGAAFTNTEEGQNKFNKIMGVIGSVTGNLIDILASLGEKLIWVFTSPREALTSFVELIKSQIINRFNAAIETVGFLGSAIKKVFSRDFSGAMEDAKKAGNSYVDVLTGVENSLEKVTNGVKDFTNELIDEAKIAGEIADKRAKADKVERQLQIDRAKANRDRADLLDKAVQKDTYTAKQRIEFLEEAGRLEEEITNKEIGAVQLRLEAREAENKLAGSTKDDLDAEVALRAQLIDLEAARLTKAKLVTTQIFAANNQLRAEEKAAQTEIDVAKKTKDAEEVAAAKKLAEVKKAIREATAISEQEKRDLELIKIDEHFEALILKAEEQNIVNHELDTALKIAKQEKEAEWDAIDLARKEAKIQKENVLEDKRTAIVNKAKDDRLLIIEAELQAKRSSIAQIGNLLGRLSGLLEKGTAASKAAALSEILINTGLGFARGLGIAQLSAQGTGFAAAAAFPIFYASQIIAVMAAIGNAKKILSQVKGGGSGGSASGGSSRGPTISAPPTVATPPDVTSVGGTGMNQLADVIGSQIQQPIQAYVVSNDVTTAQSLERNIVDGASIG